MNTGSRRICLGAGRVARMPSLTALVAGLVALLCGTPMHAADDTQLWGYTPADFSALQAHGFNQQNVFGAAVRLTVDDMFDGSLITGIDVPFNTEEAWEVTAFVASADDIDTPLTSTFSDDGTAVGYNTYTFSQPYRLQKGKDVYVGYTFRIISTATKQEKAPILTGGAAMPGGLMVYNKKEWTDYSAEGWGNSGLQVRLQGLVLPSDYAVMGKACDFSGAVNSSATCQVFLHGNSANAIHTLGYSVSLGGRTTQGTASVSVPAGLAQLATVSLAVPTPAEVGTYPVTVTLQTVNGQPVPPTSATATATLYTRLVPRYTVMEEQTGTGCMHCTRGWAGMEYMRDHYDRFIAISTHHYNAEDAMYNTGYPSIGLSSAPSCVIDRRTEAIDPLFGSNSQRYIIGDFEDCNALVPPVEVRVAGQLQPDGQSVEATASVDFLYPSPGCSVFYAITADGLTCPPDADERTRRMWMQANIFAQSETRDHFRGDGSNPLRNFYAEFAKGGQYGSTELYGLVFNDVMIGCSPPKESENYSAESSHKSADSFSYSADSKNHSAALPAEGKAGTTAQHACTVPVSCSPYCRAAIQYDRLNIVALVIDREGHVANAARARVEVPEGIGTVLTPSQPCPLTGSYGLDGRISRPAPATRTLHIINGKKILN